MPTIGGKMLREQSHTIVSLDLIKPSSPTPSHLHTYNLSHLNQYQEHEYIPLILWYPNNDLNCSLTVDDKARELKRSLSQILTGCYPFAGRLHTPTTPYVDCNDEGVVFVEAKHDIPLQHVASEDEPRGQLFAHGMVWQNAPHSTSLLAVQLNRFACGGIGVAVSMSHKVGDACTLGSFVSHWASVARYGSTDHQEILPVALHFIQSPPPTTSPSEASLLNHRFVNCVTRKFVFPNSKLSELKAECESTISMNNLTRFEVLSSLLYKSAIAPRFKTSIFAIPMNIRNKLVPKLPATTVGNILAYMVVTTKHSSEASLSVVLSEIRKEKMRVERVQSLQPACEYMESQLLRLRNENVPNRTFWCSSLCGFPYYKADFGWGKPTVASITFGSSSYIGFVLMDTPNGDGIEARVTLETQDMEIFEKDPKMLSFCQN